MNRTPVEINIPNDPRKASIVVDGRPLDAVTEIHLDASTRAFPRITLDLISPVHFQGHAHIELARSITDDLKHLGWSEPSERARLTKAIRELLDAISDMAVRNSDVDMAAMALRGELVDAGWDEAPSATLNT